jgi:hypothetical protein
MNDVALHFFPALWEISEPLGFLGCGGCGKVALCNEIGEAIFGFWLWVWLKNKLTILPKNANDIVHAQVCVPQHFPWKSEDKRAANGAELRKVHDASKYYTLSITQAFFIRVMAM